MWAHLRISPIEGMRMNCRELVLMHDAYLLEVWDHTACIMSHLHGIYCIVAALGGSKSRIAPKSPFELHPYRKAAKSSSGIKVTVDDIGALYAVANALSR